MILKTFKCAAFFGALLAWGSVPAAHAAGYLAQLEPSQDNSIYEPVIDLMSNGSGIFLFAGRTGLDGGFKARRALLKYDLAAALPANAIITYAELSLYQSKAAPNSPPAEIGLHRLSASWGEGPSNATGAEGQGAPAEAGDATWTHRFHPDTAWTAPGGDFEAAPTVTTTVGQTLGYYRWACTQALLLELNDWLQAPETNHGWILIGGEEGGQSAHRFNSRENSTPEHRPRLTLWYITDDTVFLDGFESLACP